MTDIKVTPLGRLYFNKLSLLLVTNANFFGAGAGQDVGRSCILLQMGGKNIMLDCGMHMGYNDEVRHYINSC